MMYRIVFVIFCWIFLTASAIEECLESRVCPLNPKDQRTVIAVRGFENLALDMYRKDQYTLFEIETNQCFPSDTKINSMNFDRESKHDFEEVTHSNLERLRQIQINKLDVCKKGILGNRPNGYSPRINECILQANHLSEILIKNIVAASKGLKTADIFVAELNYRECLSLYSLRNRRADE